MDYLNRHFLFQGIFPSSVHSGIYKHEYFRVFQDSSLAIQHPATHFVMLPSKNWIPVPLILHERITLDQIQTSHSSIL